MTTSRKTLATGDGRFSEDGQSFVVPRPDTPHPLVNVMSTGGYGVAMAQTGAGCSWGRRPSEPVTRGSALFTRDAGGRALYLRDDRTGRFWSVGWQPLRMPPESYECVHGVGHTLITSQTEGIQAQWLVFVPHEEPLEVWRVRLRNVSKKSRAVSLWSAVDWAPHRAGTDGNGASSHDGGKVLLAKAHPSTAGDWEGRFFHGCHLAPRAAAIDRRAFWGAYGSSEAPEALKKGRYLAGGGREPFAGFCVPFTLKPGEERSLLLTVGSTETQSEALLKARKFQDFAQVDHAWNRTQLFWDRCLSSFSVESPDAGFNVLMNTWLKYQALSEGLWGGRGSRDARILLPLDASRVRREILARASSPKALAIPFSDVPWPVLLADYLKESGEGRLLTEKVSPRDSLYAAAHRAVTEIAALPPKEEPWIRRFLSEWAEMVQWAVDEGHLPPREKGTARKWRAEALRRAAAFGTNGHRKISVQALEDACRRGRPQEAWDIYGRLTPLSARPGASTLFAPELAGSEGPAPAALFRSGVEGILGVMPEWKGLRVRPCLPPGWRGARIRREFRGASYAIEVRRDASKPAGRQGIRLNGRKISGEILPVMFGLKNDVRVTVGRAR